MQLWTSFCRQCYAYDLLRHQFKECSKCTPIIDFKMDINALVSKSFPRQMGWKSNEKEAFLIICCMFINLHIRNLHIAICIHRNLHTYAHSPSKIISIKWKAILTRILTHLFVCSSLLSYQCAAAWFNRYAPVWCTHRLHGFNAQ